MMASRIRFRAPATLAAAAVCVAGIGVPAAMAADLVTISLAAEPVVSPAPADAPSPTGQPTLSPTFTPQTTAAAQPGAQAAAPASSAPATSGSAATFDGKALSGSLDSRHWPGRQVGWKVAVPDGPVRGTVLVLHGKTDSAEKAFTELGLEEQAKATGFALAAIDGDSTYWSDDGAGTDTGRMVTEEFLPLLASKGLPVDRIGLTGYSMGGLGSLLIAERLGPQRVFAVAPMSAAVWEGGKPGVEGEAQREVRANAGKLSGIPTRIVSGTEDDLTEVNKSLAELVPQAETKWSSGSHDFGYWGPALAEQLKWMSEKQGAAPQAPPSATSTSSSSSSSSSTELASPSTPSNSISASDPATPTVAPPQTVPPQPTQAQTSTPPPAPLSTQPQPTAAESAPATPTQLPAPPPVTAAPPQAPTQQPAPTTPPGIGPITQPLPQAPPSPTALPQEPVRTCNVLTVTVKINAAQQTVVRIAPC